MPNSLSDFMNKVKQLLWWKLDGFNLSCFDKE